MRTLVFQKPWASLHATLLLSTAWNSRCVKVAARLRLAKNCKEMAPVSNRNMCSICLPWPESSRWALAGGFRSFSRNFCSVCLVRCIEGPSQSGQAADDHHQGHVHLEGQLTSRCSRIAKCSAVHCAVLCSLHQLDEVVSKDHQSPASRLPRAPRLGVYDATKNSRPSLSPGLL